MKRADWAMNLALVLMLCGMVVMTALPVCAQGQQNKEPKLMLVQLERTALRAGPGFAYPVLAFLPYRTVFYVLGIEKDWIYGYVQGERKPGYLHANALVSAELRAPQTSSDVPPLEASDIVMAGKGMYSSLEMLMVESNNPVLDFSLLDRLDRYSWPVAECVAFIDGAVPSRGEW